MVIRHYINEDYVRHGGYNEVGELNDVIILYPQVVPIPLNPYGCWDGYGYTGAMFGTFPKKCKCIELEIFNMCVLNFNFDFSY